MLTESYWPPERPDALAEVTIGDVLRRAAADHPDRVGLMWGATEPESRRSWTYQQILDTAERLARALLEHFAPGERVAVWAPNSPSYVLLQRGLAVAGLVLVPVDPAYQYAELRYVLEQSGAVGLLHATELPRYRPGRTGRHRPAGAFLPPHARRTRGRGRQTANGEPQRELPAVNRARPIPDSVHVRNHRLSQGGAAASHGRPQHGPLCRRLLRPERRRRLGQPDATVAHCRRGDDAAGHDGEGRVPSC